MTDDINDEISSWRTMSGKNLLRIHPISAVFGVPLQSSRRFMHGYDHSLLQNVQTVRAAAKFRPPKKRSFEPYLTALEYTTDHSQYLGIDSQKKKPPYDYEHRRWRRMNGCLRTQ